VARHVEDGARLDVELARQDDPFHGGLGVDVERLLRASFIFRVEAVLVRRLVDVDHGRDLASSKSAVLVPLRARLEPGRAHVGHDGLVQGL